MWALSDIKALNARAEAEYKKAKKSKALRGKTCDYCDEKAVVAEQYYDIFGNPDIPKGRILLCNEHADNGASNEGHFWCDGCTRYHVTNYTWELYSRHTEDGTLCLRCALHEALDSEDPSENPWVYRSDVEQLKAWLDAGKIDQAFDWLRHKAKHLIAVESTYWEERLIFQANVELDSGSGAAIRGFHSCDDSRGPGLREIVGHLEKVIANADLGNFLTTLGAKARPEPRCALILDGAYQFAVSIGIYYERKHTGAAKKEVKR